MRSGSLSPRGIDQRDRRQSHGDARQHTPQHRGGNNLADRGIGQLQDGGEHTGRNHEQPKQRPFHGIFGPVQRHGRSTRALHRLDSRFGTRAEELVVSSCAGLCCADLLWSAHVLLNLRNLRHGTQKGDKEISRICRYPETQPKRSALSGVETLRCVICGGRRNDYSQDGAPA